MKGMQKRGVLDEQGGYCCFFHELVIPVILFRSTVVLQLQSRSLTPVGFLDALKLVLQIYIYLDQVTIRMWLFLLCFFHAVHFNKVVIFLRPLINACSMLWVFEKEMLQLEALAIGMPSTSSHAKEPRKAVYTKSSVKTSVSAC